MIILIPIVVFLAFLVICALMTTGEPLNPTRPLMSYEQAREYARKLQRMITCRTVSHKDSFEDAEFEKLSATVRALFPLVHQHCQRMIFGEDCWVYLLKGLDEDHNIMLMSHHDVAEAEGEWQHPPFSGAIADGKLWGRGTVDTKTSLFAIFAALEELLAEGYVPNCNVWIASSHNEEIAGDGIPLAARYFREQGITFDFVLDEGGAIIDPPMSGMICSKCAMVAIHEKGRHRLILTAREGSSHSGLTAGARATPTERMAEFIAEFRRENIFIRRMTPELEGMLRAMAPYMTFPMRIVFSNLWLFKPLLVKLMPKISPQAGGLLGTTCAFNDLTTQEGGKCCTARILLRSIDVRDLQTDLQALRTLAARYDIEISHDGEDEFHAPADPSLPPFAKVSRCIREVFPDVPVIPFILPAGTDARTLTELCPCVLRFAPLRLSSQQLASVHSENENIDISAIGTAVVFYRRVLETYSPGDPPAEHSEDMDFEDLFDDGEETAGEEVTVDLPEEVLDSLVSDLDLPEHMDPEVEPAHDFDLGDLELPEEGDIFADFSEQEDLNLSEHEDMDYLQWEDIP